MALTTTGVKVRKNSFTYGGVKYHRTNAHALRLMTWGKKRQPLGKSSYLDPQTNVPLSAFKVIKATKVDIDFEQSSTDDIAADLRPAQIKFAGAEISTTRELASEGSLRLMLLRIDPGEVKRHIKGTPKLRDSLKDADKDMRLVLDAWVILEAKLADEVESSTNGEAAVTVKGITLGVAGGHDGSSRTEVTIKSGLFGYGLSEIEWDKQAKKKRTTVTGFRFDRKGAG
jgi:hypothetical protein